MDYTRSHRCQCLIFRPSSQVLQKYLDGDYCSFHAVPIVHPHNLGGCAGVNLKGENQMTTISSQQIVDTKEQYSLAKVLGIWAAVTIPVWCKYFSDPGFACEFVLI